LRTYEFLIYDICGEMIEVNLLVMLLLCWIRAF